MFGNGKRKESREARAKARAYIVIAEALTRDEQKIFAKALKELRDRGVQVVVEVERR